MVRINIHTPQALEPTEFALCAAIASTFRQHRAFVAEQIPLISSGFHCSIIKFKDAANYSAKQVARNQFVNAVLKGMEASINIKIDTITGTDEQTIPLLPVTLVNIPSFPDAMVYMEALPSFEIKTDSTGKTQIRFYDELLEWIRTDINHEPEENEFDDDSCNDADCTDSEEDYEDECE